MSVARWCATHVLVACLATVAVAAPNPEVARLAKAAHWEPAEWPTHQAMLGKPAPALELHGWLDPASAPRSWKGRIVVVDFWATWCAPCIRGIPHNNELARAFKPKGVLFVGACGAGTGGGQERMAAMAQRYGITYPTAKATRATIRAWKVNYWPTYAIIDRKGTLRAIGVVPDAVEPIVKALLSEQPR